MPRKKTKRVKHVESEHMAQRTVVEYLRYRGVGVFSVPNGAIFGKTKNQSKWALIGKLKAEGMLNGAPDLILTRQAITLGYLRPVAIEMKRIGGSLSAEQLAIQQEMMREGWHVLVGYGSDDAISKIDNLLF